jgi:hypothetical protein
MQQEARSSSVAPGRISRISGILRRWGGWLFSGERERTLYALVAASCILWVAVLFFSSMRQQLQMLYASLEGSPLSAELQRLGPWSAPLDDVFIHFDFARATARGYPFQWSEGNGYSTGGTSLLYPFVLAFGYWIGFRKLWLMVWAAIVASVSLLGFLLAVRRLFRDLPVWCAYLAPPAVLGVGALSWTLFSGMEVALFLGLWGGALVLWDDLLTSSDRSATLRTAAALGCCGALLVATRPEAVTTVALFSTTAAAVALRRHRGTTAVQTLLLAAAPGAAVVIFQALVNHWLTGDSAAAGAVAKLEMHDPFRSPEQILADWRFFVRYQVERLTQYHLADDSRHGWILWILAVVPLVPRATRRYALLLWASAVTWVLVVGLNGQVRWQNERYAMPALAWLMLLSALGAAVLVSRPQWQGWRRSWWHLVSVVSVLLAVAFFSTHQRARFRDQVWFFGRASRNILEQHVQAGLLLRYAMRPPPGRVALGDAGAIPYVADLPALDLIGLGGYRQLPFARAKRLGLGAVLELVERIPPTERPDVLALYPSWWGMLPLWFGDRIVEVPVRGNVICGGSSKVLYQPDWSAFAGSGTPPGLNPREELVDSLDVADLVDESAHQYQLSQPRTGHVTMRILPNPHRPEVDLWDAARLIPGEVVETFVLTGFDAGRRARLIVRVATAEPFDLEVRIDDLRLESKHVAVRDGWQHLAFSVPATLVTDQLRISVRSDRDRDSFHLWAVQGR